MNDSGIDVPLISCFMATRDREGFVLHAIACFEHQTYPNLELVIIDHGTDRTGEAVGALPDSRIRYQRIDAPGFVTGDIKNVALQNCLGEYVAVWDDDDWHDPQRIERQFDTLRSNQADVCVLERLTIAWPERDKYAYSERRIWEGSMVARKVSLPPYGTTLRGEDTAQMESIVRTGLKIVALDEPDLYIYNIHGHNTWYPNHFEYMFHRATYEIPREVVPSIDQKLGLDVQTARVTIDGSTRSQTLRQIYAETERAHQLLAQSLEAYAAQRYVECIASAELALQIDPYFPEAWNNIAAAQNMLGNWIEGRKAAQEALALRPDFATAKANLAWALDLANHKHSNG